MALLLKVILMGDGAVGKTAIRLSYLGKPFLSDYMMTLGADYSIEEETIEKVSAREKVGGEILKLIIFDLAGQPRFKIYREVFYKGSHGALLVVDVTRPSTFDVSTIKSWLDELHTNSRVKEIPVVLVGHKIDLRDPNDPAVLSLEEGQRLAHQFGLHYIETSAKTGYNIRDSFKLLGLLILESRRAQVSPEAQPKESSDFLTSTTNMLISEDYSIIRDLYSIINETTFAFRNSLQYSQGFRIIQLLENNIEKIVESNTVIRCISNLYKLSSDYQNVEGNWLEAVKHRFKAYETLVQIEEGKLRTNLALDLVNWFWEQLIHPINLTSWVNEFKTHKKLLNLAYSEGGRFYHLGLQAMEAIKLGDADLLDHCESQLLSIHELFPEAKNLIENTNTAISSIRKTLPIGRLVEYRFDPHPLLYGLPAIVSVLVKNNNYGDCSFKLILRSSGFEHKVDQQQVTIASKGQKQVSFLLGKVQEDITKEELRILIRLLDESNQTILEDEVPAPDIQVPEKPPKYATIFAIEVDKEEVILDKTTSITIRAKLINPTMKNQTVQLDLEGPAFVKTNFKTFPKRRLPPVNITSQKEKEYTVESIMLGSPKKPGEYHIHLRLLDSKGEVIPNSDKDVSFTYKITRSKKVINFVKGVLTTAKALK